MGMAEPNFPTTRSKNYWQLKQQLGTGKLRMLVPNCQFGSFRVFRLLWIFPFLFVSATTISTGSVASVVVSGAFLSLIGADEARTSVGSVWWSGLQMMIGLSAGFAGYLIGSLVGSVPV